MQYDKNVLYVRRHSYETFQKEIRKEIGESINFRAHKKGCL